MKKIFLILIILISSIGFSQTANDIDIIEKLTLKKINEYRKKNNKNELLMVDTISDDARKHSNKMLKAGYLFHADYSYWSGENCGCIKTFNDFITYDEISNEIVESWIQSPLHNRALLLNGDKAGIGLSITKNGKFFFTYRIVYSKEHWDKDKRLALDRL